MSRIDQETLSAFLDGELGELERRRVEAALARDPELWRQLDGLARVDTWLRRGLEPALEEKLVQPAREANLVQPTSAATPAVSRRPRRLRRRTALVAGIAGLLLGLGGPTLLTERGRETPLETALAEALERHPSGSPLRFADRDAGGSGEVVPIRTFRNVEGRWCREYELTLRDRHQELRRLAIACREENGRWRTRLALEDA